MQKRILLAVVAVFVTVLSTFAQKAGGKYEKAGGSANFYIAPNLSPMASNDTLVPPIFSESCAASLITYYSNNWGFISGTNGYGDFEKAQLFSLPATGSNFKIQELWAFFIVASPIGNGPLRGKIYSESGGAPNTLLATSADIQVGQIALDDNFIVPTIFAFAPAVNITGSKFFGSVDIRDLYATSDTVGLWMTEDGCGDGAETYELWNDETWNPIDEAWNGLESNFLMGVVVQFDEASSTNAPASLNGLSLYPASPNPASTELRLPYSLENAGNTEISIYSTDGRLIQRIDKGFQPAGKFTEVLDINQLPAGAYIYGVSTNSARLMSRFVVER